MAALFRGVERHLEAHALAARHEVDRAAHVQAPLGFGHGEHALLARRAKKGGRARLAAADEKDVDAAQRLALGYAPPLDRVRADAPAGSDALEIGGDAVGSRHA